MSARVVFMGSPGFASTVLAKLSAAYDVAGVVTQPDRPAGRGKVLTPPPVKGLAVSLGLEVIQPRRLSDPGVYETLQGWKPDVIIVAAFGQILRQNVLDLPPRCCLNVHASLLPRWRGAAPIQAAILHGDVKTGVTIMKMDAGIDTGAILAQKDIPIQEDDTAATLTSSLAELGAELLLETLPGYLLGEIIPVSQNEKDYSYAPTLKKKDGQLDLGQPAGMLAKKVNAFNPWPGAFIFWRGRPLKIHRAHAEVSNSGEPGKKGVVERKPALGTIQGWLVLDELQPAGKKALAGEVFLNGARDWMEN